MTKWNLPACQFFNNRSLHWLKFCAELDAEPMRCLINFSWVGSLSNLIPDVYQEARHYLSEPEVGSNDALAYLSRDTGITCNRLQLKKCEKFILEIPITNMKLQRNKNLYVLMWPWPLRQWHGSLAQNAISKWQTFVKLLWNTQDQAVHAPTTLKS